MVNLPFLEITVEVLEDETLSKSQVLSLIEKRIEHATKITPKYLKSPENPILRFDFPTISAFEQYYTRDSALFDMYIQYREREGLKILEQSKSVHPSVELESIYLVVRYRTNFKNPIRTNYRFVMSIIPLLDIRISYEEISDGFLLFFKRKEDFEDMAVDTLNLADIKKMMIRKNLWTEKSDELIKKALGLPKE